MRKSFFAAVLSGVGLLASSAPLMADMSEGGRLLPQVRVADNSSGGRLVPQVLIADDSSGGRLVPQVRVA